MNIEEERLAFELAVPGGTEGVDQAVRLSRFADLKILDAAFFEVWLAAKAHATEMAKPTGSVSQGRMGDWWIKYDVYQCGGFLTAYDAMDWLTSNGYRVVSE